MNKISLNKSYKLLQWDKYSVLHVLGCIHLYHRGMSYYWSKLNTVEYHLLQQQVNSKYLNRFVHLNTYFMVFMYNVLWKKLIEIAKICCTYLKLAMKKSNRGMSNIRVQCSTWNINPGAIDRLNQSISLYNLIKIQTVWF